MRKPREYRLYGVFNHPIRAKIIDILHTRGSMSFTELRNEISVSVGSIYYHLSVLGELITQDEKKRYLLTDLGIRTAKHLETNPLEATPRTPSANLPITERLAPIISGSFILQGVSLSPLRHSVEAVLIIFLGGWVTSLAGLEPQMLFLFEGTSLSSTSIVLNFILGWFAIFAVSDIIATVVFKSSRGHLPLLVGSTYALLPLILFALLWLYRETYPLSLAGAFGVWPFRILFFLLQVWSFLILSSSIKISKNLTASRSVVIVLFLVYLNITFTLLENIP